jgi:hypothetical protein
MYSLLWKIENTYINVTGDSSTHCSQVLKGKEKEKKKKTVDSNNGIKKFKISIYRILVFFSNNYIWKFQQDLKQGSHNVICFTFSVLQQLTYKIEKNAGKDYIGWDKSVYSETGG